MNDNFLDPATIFTIITGAGIIITLIINIREHRQSTAAQFTSILTDLSREHSTMLLNEEKLDTEIQCEVHALAYCDLLDRIAYLAINKKIPRKMIDKFEGYFSYVQLFMVWYDDTLSSEYKIKAADRWCSTIAWCTDEKLKKREKPIPPDDEITWLPPVMQKMWDTKKYQYRKKENLFDPSKPMPD